MPDAGVPPTAAAAAAAAPAPGRLGWLWLAAVVIAADQASKAAIVTAFRGGGEAPLTSFLSLILTYNTGAAFSFLAGAAGWQRWLFAAIALAAAALIVALLRRGGNPLYCAGLALILGGALGNLWDRLALGKVVDFVLFHYGTWSFPAFNVADSCITVGAACVIVDSLFSRAGAAAPAAKET
jgi:signal peptidase II